MKGTKNRVMMSGERMEILAGVEFMSHCEPAIAAQLPSIIHRLCRTLSKRPVAQTFINEIRIGETVALVDKQTGCTFRLKMKAHAVLILDISKTATPPNDTAKTPKTYYLVNSRLWQTLPGGLAVAA